MGYNDRYWSNKENRAKVAVQHTDYMAQNYTKQINQAVQNTKIYMEDMNQEGRFIQVNKENKSIGSVDVPNENDTSSPKIIVDDKDSVTALYNYQEGRTCVLNFASFRNPGGKFIEGSKAQEESLCHESCLYNVLKSFRSYYSYNETFRHKGLYANRALYSNDIVFERAEGGVLLADVLTCAAPNLSAYMHYIDIRESERVQNNKDALESRIHFIKAIVEDNKVDTCIFGAYGCGVFGQDALQVAQIFKKEFEYTTVKNLIYAIPSNMDKENYLAFCTVFGTV